MSIFSFERTEMWTLGKEHRAEFMMNLENKQTSNDHVQGKQSCTKRERATEASVNLSRGIIQYRTLIWPQLIQYSGMGWGRMESIV